MYLVPIDCFSSTIMEDIVDFCETINNGVFIVELFAKDIINQDVQPLALKSFNYKNMNYYVLNTIDFLVNYNILSMRHFCIYSTSKNIDEKTIRKIINHSDFYVIDENYMEIIVFVIKTGKKHIGSIAPWIQ